MAIEPTTARAPSATSVFDRVVCAIDASHGSGVLLAGIRVAPSRPDIVPLEAGHGLPGHRVDALLRELLRHRATLAVSAIHERSRAVGIAAGSVATHLLHEAPCSVLVVPEGELSETWPASIAVGLDGSVESAAAAAAAWELARRTGASVRAIAATGRPGHADLELVRRIAPRFEEHSARAVTALGEVSEEVDLVVVGSRGLRGVRALGSVSERVAHEARCPVLVVRGEPEG